MKATSDDKELLEAAGKILQNRWAKILEAKTDGGPTDQSLEQVAQEIGRNYSLPWRKILEAAGVPSMGQECYWKDGGEANHDS